MASETRSMTPPFSDLQCQQQNPSNLDELEQDASKSITSSMPQDSSLSEKIQIDNNEGSEGLYEKSIASATKGLEQEKIGRIKAATPVFGKEKAKKFLKALGSQKKYQSERQSKQSNSPSPYSPSHTLLGKKMANESTVKVKPLTPTEQAKLTVNEIERLKRNGAVAPLPKTFTNKGIIHHIPKYTLHERIAKVDDDQSENDIFKSVKSLEALRAAYEDDTDELNNANKHLDNDKNIHEEKKQKSNSSRDRKKSTDNNSRHDRKEKNNKEFNHSKEFDDGNNDTKSTKNKDRRRKSNDYAKGDKRRPRDRFRKRSRSSPQIDGDDRRGTDGQKIENRSAERHSRSLSLLSQKKRFQSELRGMHQKDDYDSNKRYRDRKNSERDVSLGHIGDTDRSKDRKISERDMTISQPTDNDGHHRYKDRKNTERADSSSNRSNCQFANSGSVPKNIIRYTKCIPVLMFAENGKFPKTIIESKTTMKEQSPTPDAKGKKLKISEKSATLPENLKEREFEEGEIETPEKYPISSDKSNSLSRISTMNYNSSKSLDFCSTEPPVKVNPFRRHNKQFTNNEANNKRSSKNEFKYKTGKEYKKVRTDSVNKRKNDKVKEKRKFYDDNDDADTAEEGELLYDQETRSEPDTEEYMSNWEDDELSSSSLFKTTSLGKHTKKEDIKFPLSKNESIFEKEDIAKSPKPEVSKLDTIQSQLDVAKKKTNEIIAQNCERIEKTITETLPIPKVEAKLVEEGEFSLTPPHDPSVDKKIQTLEEPSSTPPRNNFIDIRKIVGGSIKETTIDEKSKTASSKENLSLNSPQKPASHKVKEKNVDTDGKSTTTKRTLEPKIASLYDEYEQFLLSVESCEPKKLHPVLQIDKTKSLKLKSPVEKLETVLNDKKSVETVIEEDIPKNNDNAVAEKSKKLQKKRRVSDESTSHSSSSTTTTDSSYSSSDENSDVEESTSESSSSSSSSSDSTDSDSSSSSSTSSQAYKNRTKKKKLTKTERNIKRKNKHDEGSPTSASIEVSELLPKAEKEPIDSNASIDPLQEMVAPTKDLSTVENITAKALESLGLVWDEHLLSDDDLLLKVETFKIHCKEKKREKEKAGREKNRDDAYDIAVQNEEEGNRTDEHEKHRSQNDGILNDPNRSMITLKIKSTAPHSHLAPVSHTSNPLDLAERLPHNEPPKIKSSPIENQENRISLDKRGSKPEPSRLKRNKEEKPSIPRRSTSRKRHRSRTPQSSKYSSSNDQPRRRRSIRGNSISPGGKNSRRRKSNSPSLRGHRRRSSYKRSHSGSRSGRKSSLTPPKSSQRYHSRHQKSASPPLSRRHRSISHSPTHHEGKMCSMSPQPAPRGPRTPPNTPPADSMLDNDMSQFSHMGRAQSNTHHNDSWNAGGLNQSPMDKISNKMYANYDYEGTGSTPIPRLHSSGISGPYRQPPPPISYNENDYNNYMHPHQHRPPVPHLSHSHLMPHQTHYHPNQHQLQHPPQHPPQHQNQPNRQLMAPHLAQHHQDQHHGGFGPSHANIPPALGSGDGFYYQTSFEPDPMAGAPLESASPRPFSNLIEVHVQPSAVQKGNVLEIVPSSELRNERRMEKSHSDEEQHQANEAQRKIFIQQQIRIKQKLERQQRRLAKEKRKESVVAEIKRLNEQLLVGTNGKMIRASDLFANPAWRNEMLTTEGASLPIANASLPANDLISEIKLENEPTLHVYDPTASAGKSILSEKIGTEDIPIIPNDPAHPKKSVVFADGVHPGEGTSASENEDGQNEGINANSGTTTSDKKRMKKKLLSRSKHSKRNKSSSKINSKSNLTSLSDKDNFMDGRIKIESGIEHTTNEEYIPPPPPGSPPANLPQPKLKNPENFIVHQLLYFHYNIHEHSMYVSTFNYPTHRIIQKPPPSSVQAPSHFSRKHKVANGSPNNSEHKTFSSSKKSNQVPTGHHNNKLIHPTPSHAAPPGDVPIPYPSGQCVIENIQMNPYPPTQFNPIPTIVTQPAQYMGPVPVSTGTISQTMPPGAFEDPNNQHRQSPQSQIQFRVPPPSPQNYANQQSQMSQTYRFPPANYPSGAAPTNKMTFLPPH